jgi:hypothetical protein
MSDELLSFNPKELEYFHRCFSENAATTKKWTEGVGEDEDEDEDEDYLYVWHGLV